MIRTLTLAFLLFLLQTGAAFSLIDLNNDKDIYEKIREASLKDDPALLDSLIFPWSANDCVTQVEKTIDLIYEISILNGDTNQIDEIISRTERSLRAHGIFNEAVKASERGVCLREYERLQILRQESARNLARNSFTYTASGCRDESSRAIYMAKIMLYKNPNNPDSADEILMKAAKSLQIRAIHPLEKDSDDRQACIAEYSKLLDFMAYNIPAQGTSNRLNADGCRSVTLDLIYSLQYPNGGRSNISEFTGIKVLRAMELINLKGLIGAPINSETHIVCMRQHEILNFMLNL